MTMFHIICLDTQETVKEGETPKLYQSGAEASAAAKALTEASGKRHQPRPVKDDGWLDREAKRLADGTYTRVPWDEVGRPTWGGGTYSPEDCAHHWWYNLRKPEAANHFAHVSIKNPGKIAFTETPEKGAADVQTTMLPGRYLRAFYNELTERDIRQFSNEFTAAYGNVQLKFAHTADEIEHVYTNGPSSCMSHDASHFSSSIHPSRVYAAGDLAVAYLVADDEEHITARAVCWPDKKTYSRVYGDEDKLQKLLDDAGYRHTERCTVDARLLRIEEYGGFVLPYLDHVYRARDNGKHLVVDPDGDIDGESTTGLAETSGQECARCGNRYDEENEGSYIDSRDAHWCDNCAERHAFYCEGTGTMVANDDGVEMDNGEFWSQRRFDREGCTTDDGENIPLDDAVMMQDGSCWSQDSFDRNGRQCSHCGDCLPSDVTCDNCEEDTLEEEAAAPVHIARPGRDENDNQLELTLVPKSDLTPAEAAQVGDIIRIEGSNWFSDGDYTVTRVCAGMHPGSLNAVAAVSINYTGGVELYVEKECIKAILTPAEAAQEGDSVLIAGDNEVPDGWHIVHSVDTRPEHQGDGLRVRVVHPERGYEYVWNHSVRELRRANTALSPSVAA